ncbi:MAG: tetratricopeptide repeat protein [Akkermansiaceae bacterium]
MSKIIPLLIAGTLISQAFAQSPAQQSEALYKQGQAAENAGDPTTAQEHYANALRTNPKNANALYSLGQLKINSASIAAKGREAKFGSVMIPIYQLDAASLQEALEGLNIIIEKQSKEEVTPNFVIEDPKGLFADRKITLNLKNMPTRAVMKYITDQTGAKVRYDEHAVVIVPK